jgi:hypothetical protein
MMADAATEIDLDSVIDRLLEGESCGMDGGVALSASALAFSYAPCHACRAIWHSSRVPGHFCPAPALRLISQG